LKYEQKDGFSVEKKPREIHELYYKHRSRKTKLLIE